MHIMKIGWQDKLSDQIVTLFLENDLNGSFLQKCQALSYSLA